MRSKNLPIPDDVASQHSERVKQFIVDKIIAAGGQIPFAEFMQYALYAPGLGYYSAGKTKFGSAGDFITAPELSPLFGRCVANTIEYSTILEFGAGSGKLAATLLQNCPQIERYYMLEISADLRAQQQTTLQEQCPNFFHKVQWLDALPKQKIKAVIIANEVLDAMPATRFHWENNQVSEYYVQYQHEQLQWHLDKASDKRITKFVTELALPDNYTSEMNLLLTPWLSSLSDILEEGIILLFDYGFPRREFYHPERNMGTLMCHYRHHAHSDPFYYPGLQDITTHVDFTAVAEAAHRLQLDIVGYTSQAAFLLDCGLLELASSQVDAQAIKILTLPAEMGEIFKVIALTRRFNSPLRGFRLQDRRNRL